MLLKANTGAVEGEGLTDTKAFTIKADAVMAHILSQQIYQDPIGAIVREYANNGWDGQKMLGNEDRPLSVKVPTSFDPVFIVRDYGVGMSNDQLIERMSTYGESSKRADKKQIGGLGIGSKSGFARAESFVITSWYDGFKTSFVCSKGSDGMFEISRLSEPEPSTEHTGVEVAIPVAITDISTYQKRIRSFFARWTVKPIFSGYSGFEVDKIDYVIEARGWKLRAVQPNSYVTEAAFAVMGQTAYQIDVSKIPNITSDEREILQLPIDFQFAVSDLTVAVSREALSYDVRTVQVLKMKAAQVRADVPLHFGSAFTGCNTLWEAKVKYNELVDKGPIAKLLKLGVEWNGITLKNRYINAKLPPGQSVRTCDKRQSKLMRIPFTLETDVQLDPASNPRVIKLDVRGSIQRVIGHDMYRRTDGCPIVLIEDNEHFDAIIDQLGNPPWEKLSDIPAPPAPVRVKGQRAQVVKKLFVYDGNDFIDTEIDISKGGVFVGLENGDPIGHKVHVRNLHARLRSLGIPIRLVGIPRTNKAVETKPGWVHIDDYVKAELAQRPLPGQAVVDSEYLRRFFDENSNYRPFRELADKLTGKMFEKLAATLKAMTPEDRDVLSQHVSLLRDYGMSFKLPTKPSADISKQLMALTKKYPLIVQFAEENSIYDIKKPATLALFQAYVDAV